MTEFVNPPRHLSSIAIRYCPKCGRNDRYQDFGRTKHYDRNGLCDGKVVKLIYRYEGLA